MSSVNLGIERSFSSAPTLDTERNSILSGTRGWSPTSISIFGHQISVDITTGNLLAATTDVTYPHYDFSLGITRNYDLQEQHMQLSWMRRHPNVNPKPHWFGNWRFAFEADIDEVWRSSYPELHINSGVGLNGLFETIPPHFKRNLKDVTPLQSILFRYGIPQRTLKELDWQFTENDFILRTLRGPFNILTGHYYEETMVDDVQAQLWVFNPISGWAYKITSDYNYNISSEGYRDVGFPLMVSNITDALGHRIELKPATAGGPYQAFTLSDTSGRLFHMALKEELTYLDGLKSGREVRKYLVSTVKDATKETYNKFEYTYTSEKLLKEIIYPSSLGNRYIRYHYGSLEYPGVLTAIEDHRGNILKLEYIEDPSDNDERLNPRLKIKQITDPVGIVFNYDYHPTKQETTVTVSQNGSLDRKLKYEYIRDVANTKLRYITLTEIVIKRGFYIDAENTVAQIQVNNPQIVRRRTKYTADGRFNVETEIDPLNRTTNSQYNEFNQIRLRRDYDNHWTEYHYDIDETPLRYDLVRVAQENLIRTPDILHPGQIIEQVQIIETTNRYKRYDGDTSADLTDHGVHSTHRISEMTDARGKVWKYFYADALNSSPLLPTSLVTPLGHTTLKTYNNRGEVLTIIDAELNKHVYIYDQQGTVKNYTDPNGRRTEFFYYPEANWLQRVVDQNTEYTDFIREVDGLLKTIVDPVRQSIDYEYYMNQRLKNVIRHRPPAPSDPLDLASSIINPDLNLVTEFQYFPLGNLRALINPKGLELTFHYDEAGRLCQWHYNIPAAKTTKLIYDSAGQLLHTVDRKDQRTDYTYYNSGYLKSIQYPGWSDGVNFIPGKFVYYSKYDHVGQVCTVTDSEIPEAYQFIYDVGGNLLVRRDPDGVELRFAYDDDNRLWNVEDSSGIYKLTINLDPLGRPISLKDSTYLDGSLQWDYVYQKDVAGLKQVLNLYRQNLGAIGFSSFYSYDKKNRLATIEHHWDGPPDTTIYSRTFQYSPDDLLMTITGDDANSFQYDNLKQLISETSGHWASDYDHAGNRLFRINTAAIPNPPLNEYNVINQLKTESESMTIINYDENGNLSSSNNPNEQLAFYFDGSNKLRLIKTNQYEIRYMYDLQGKLLERQTKNTGSGQIENTRWYYLLTKPIIVKRNGDLYGLITWDTNGKLLRIRMADQLATDTNVYLHSLFPVYDGLGNIVRIMDAKRNVVMKASFDAWLGQESNDPMKLMSLCGCRSGTFEDKSGLILFGARWYSPKYGRWISEDPNDPSDAFPYLESNNLYVYALNNPNGFSDSSGLQSEWRFEQDDGRGIPLEGMRLREEVRRLRFSPTPNEVRANSIFMWPFMAVGLAIIGYVFKPFTRASGVGTLLGTWKAGSRYVESRRSDSLDINLNLSLKKEFLSGFATGFTLSVLGAPGKLKASTTFLLSAPSVESVLLFSKQFSQAWAVDYLSEELIIGHPERNSEAE